MKVALKRPYFGPDATLYKPEDGSHQFPEAWREGLPADAEVTEGEAEAKPVPEEED